jgi:hypothetical protein
MRFLIALLLVFAAPANAATITVEPASGNTPAVVGVQGILRSEDIEEFRLKIRNLSTALVAFESDGGHLLAGIRIGEMIRLRGLATLVPPGARCASACAIAWLGGVQRFMGDPALIGFHAAYHEGATGIAESGMGNAVLGAYLNSLGLSEGAIAYITMAAPNEMTWLTLQEAAKHGIEVRSLQANAATSVPPTTKRAEPKQRAASVPEDTHGLLGNWQCAGVETQSAWFKSNQYRINGILQISRFDGKYYWAEGVFVGTPVGNAPPKPVPKQTVKEKLWFEGGKLYRGRYWRSDAISQEVFDAEFRALPITLQDNVMIVNHTFHVTHNGTDWSVHSSGRCAK